MEYLHIHVIVVPFPIAKVRVSLVPVSRHEWRKKIYTHTTLKKKGGECIVCRKMEDTGDYNVKQKKPDLDKYYMFSLLCRI